MQKQLDLIKKECENCQKCALGATRTKLVFSSGVPNNKLVLVGEAPGYWEDQKGEPFVGKAGQLFSPKHLPPPGKITKQKCGD